MRHLLVPILALTLLSACGGDDDDVDAASASDAALTSDARGNPDASTTDAATYDAVVYDAGPIFDAVPVSSDIRINEFVMDHSGGSDTGEFVELKGAPNTDYSAFELLQINGDYFEDGTGRGVVVTIHDVGTTDANGYFLPDISPNTFENGTQTLLLVYNSTAATRDDIDGNDDGTIDNPLWTELVDAVAVFDGRPMNDNNDHTYAGTVVLDKVYASSEPVAFGGASRIPDGTDTDSSSDWVSNTANIDNSGIASGEARNTPGAANSVEPE